MSVNFAFVIKRIDELKEGDLVDLAGDIFADPRDDNPALECEFATVLDVERETPECVCIYFDSITAGFPPTHHVRVPV